MDDCDERETQRQEYETKSREASFPQPLDHAAKQPRSDKHSHSTEIHHEEANVGLSDWEPVREDERKCRRGAIKGANRNRIDPDQTLRWLTRPRDDTPDRAASGLDLDSVLAGAGRILTRFAQVHR